MKGKNGAVCLKFSPRREDVFDVFLYYVSPVTSGTVVRSSRETAFSFNTLSQPFLRPANDT